MRKPLAVLLTVLLWMAATASANEPATQEVDLAPAVDTPERIAPPTYGSLAGTVTQTMDVAQYTYVEVDTGEGLIWAAGPATPVKVGDTVELPNAMTMTNFHSSALNRTFDLIRFAPEIQVKSK